MPKILCTIPGAPTEIGGLNGLVKFTPTDRGLVSADDLPEDEAAHFASIPGYMVEAPAVDPDAGERALLQARAEAAGLRVDSRWKLPRLRTEVEEAEKEVAEAAAKKAEAEAAAKKAEAEAAAKKAEAEAAAKKLAESGAPT